MGMDDIDIHKAYKSHFFEMANVPSKRTGLLGIVQIRPEDRHILFPHIHYVRNVRLSEVEFLKVSISKNDEDIKVIENKNFEISSKEFKSLKKFITLNYDKLLMYYTQAEYITDTSEYLSKFKKV